MFVSSVFNQFLAKGLSARDRPERIIRRLSLCGALAPALLLLLYIIASFFNPGFDHVSKTVSQLGVNSSNFPWVIDSAFILFGVLIVPLASGLYLRFRRHFMAKLLWLAMVLCGAGAILSGVFHAEKEMIDNLPLLEGMLHIMFASLAILSLAVGMLAAADIFQRYQAWRGFVWPSVVISAAVLVGTMLFSQEILSSWNGLIERVFYTLALGWVWVIAMKSFMLPLSDRV
jgi:hypothetical membrane protein